MHLSSSPSLLLLTLLFDKGERVVLDFLVRRRTLQMHTGLGGHIQRHTTSSRHHQSTNLGRVRLFNARNTRATLSHLKEVYHLASYTSTNSAGGVVQLSQAREC